MIVETESSAIINKIDNQCKGIVEKIKNRQPSKSLHQIEIWVRQQINSGYMADNIQLLAIIIDVIYQFFKKESDIDKTSLIEKCLACLINNQNKLSAERIQEITDRLKIYNKTDDTEAQTILKEFIAKFSGSTNFFHKIVSSCENSLIIISNSIKSELKNTPSSIEQATDAALAPIPFFEPPSSVLVEKKSTKYKKLTRIIKFNENGEGYIDNEKKRIIKKKINFIQENNEKSIRPVYLSENETQLTKDIREAYFFINFLKRNEICYNYEKDIKNIFQSIALEEFKAIIFKIIYDLKVQDSKNIFYQYNKTKVFLLPHFLDIQNEYRDEFLLLINFSTLEKLAEKAEIISDNISTLIPMLDDIIEFYSEWNVNHPFSKFILLRDSFKSTFDRKIFVNYLEDMISMIEMNKLKLDKITLEFHCKVSGLTLKNFSDDLKIKIDQFKSELSIDEFLKRQQEAIQFYFNKNFQINLDNFDLKTDLLGFKLTLIKLYKFMLNFFCINFFINYISNVDFFKSKLDLLNLELDCLSPEKINDEFTSKLNWLTLLKNGINPFFLLYKPYKKNLLEKLFLYIVNIKFLNTIEINSDIGAFSNKKHKLLNDLRLIQICLENAKIGSISDLTCCYDKKNIDIRKTGEQLTKLFNDSEAFKEFLKALIILEKNTQVLNEEFSMLCDTTQKNIVNTWEAQINNDLSKHIKGKNCLFKLPQFASQIPSSNLILNKI